jgi:hypothetical protein
VKEFEDKRTQLAEDHLCSSMSLKIVTVATAVVDPVPRKVLRYVLDEHLQGNPPRFRVSNFLPHARTTQLSAADLFSSSQKNSLAGPESAPSVTLDDEGPAFEIIPLRLDW